MQPARLIWILLIIAAALILLGASRTVPADQLVTVLPESQLWIEGTSTVNRFRCEAGQVEGYGIVEAAEAGDARAEVQVPVETFDCGRQRMNRDLYDALLAGTYPSIHYELSDVHLIEPGTVSGGLVLLRTEGHLTIAGVTHALSTTVHGYQLPDGRYRAEGRLALRMSDFGITPPSAFFGMIRTHDEITVGFDLVAGRADRLESSSTSKP